MYDELCIRLQVVCFAFTAYSAPPPFFKECLFHLNIKMQKCKKNLRCYKLWLLCEILEVSRVRYAP